MTLRDLLDGDLDLSAARLVVLSACQTGLTDFLTLPDEAIGLPAGFLQAGVPAVVGSLWPVDDLSTALLMDHFYAYFLHGDHASGDSPLPASEALRRAQLWLRTVTAEQLTAAGEQPNGSWSASLAQAVVARFALVASTEPDQRPFAAPSYWAPFVFVGAEA